MLKNNSKKLIKLVRIIVVVGVMFLGLKLLYYPNPYLFVNDFHPSWSPDGNRIAFVSNRDGNRDENTEIYLMDADGSNVTQLTPDPFKLFYNYRDDISPIWSPDGKYIAFASAKGKRNFMTDFYDPFYSYLNKIYEIYRMDADGSNMVRISGENSNCFSPSWSTDSRKIAFVCDSDVPAIYVADLDGSNITRISENGSNCFSPTWAPDGEKIAFFCDQDMEGIASVIYLIDVNGSGLRELVQIPNVGSIIWSPNGELILITELTSDKRDIINMSVINADGTDLKQLSPGFVASAPSWSPDGRQIIYVSVSSINVMNTDGAKSHAIYTIKNVDSFPYLGGIIWSPDGSRIAFSRAQIYVMDADGTNVIQLTHKPSNK